MFPALRKSRSTQTALALAGALAISSSLGLHPEPACDPSLLAAGSQPAVGVLDFDHAASHGCMACLAHRSVSLPRLAGAVLQPGPRVAAFSAQRLSNPPGLETATHEGRAPPAHD